MGELDSTEFLRAIEKFLKYARTKRFWFHTRAWVSKSTFDALVATMPTRNEAEKRLLGEATDTIIASAVAKSASRSGSFPGFYISYKALRQLERAVRKEWPDWFIGKWTRGSNLPGADYWGIDD
jgi:hypothetical protein